MKKLLCLIILTLMPVMGFGWQHGEHFELPFPLNDLSNNTLQVINGIYDRENSSGVYCHDCTAIYNFAYELPYKVECIIGRLDFYANAVREPVSSLVLTF